MISRPMKAPTEPITDEQLVQLPFPVVGSPKVDGYWAGIKDAVHTSSMELHVNPFVQSELSIPLLKGLAGELVIGKPYAGGGKTGTFANCSPLRREYGEPNFRFYVFDDFTNKNLTYRDRWIKNSRLKDIIQHPRIVLLEQRWLYNIEDIFAYEKECAESHRDENPEYGYEGIMIRSLDGLYKEGRTTFKEMNIFKRKYFDEVEAEIIGFIEGTHNLNEAKKNAMGKTKRSSNKENLIPSGTLGSFIMKSKKWDKPFTCSGGTKDFNQDVWNNRLKWMGKIMTIKYQLYGSLDAPRIPKLKSEEPRPNWDMTKF